MEATVFQFLFTMPIWRKQPSKLHDADTLQLVTVRLLGADPRSCKASRILKLH